MISFSELLERMEEDSLSSETKAMEVVRAGLNISPDFWEGFINLTGNSEGMADLLDVSRHKVANWAARIREVAAQIDKSDDEEAKDNKSELLSTGEQIGDPNGNGEGDRPDLNMTP